MKCFEKKRIYLMSQPIPIFPFFFGKFIKILRTDLIYVINKTKNHLTKTPPLPSLKKKENMKKMSITYMFTLFLSPLGKFS